MKKLSIIAMFLPIFFLSACSKKEPVLNIPIENNPKPVACTAEAKLCSDGSAVGRSGPNCEFASCPETVSSTSENIVSTTTVSTTIAYPNNQYGFSLYLPKTWEGYSASSSAIEYGNKIVIRYPEWTAKNPYEDIPILVYPLATWQAWEKNNFEGYPTAAPIGPTERGRNNVYVFATAPRYNYDFQPGFEEVEKIIAALAATNLAK